MTKQFKENIIIISFSLISAFLVMFRLLGEKLFRLNEIQWDNSGDGFKNYFNFAYHYNYGEGLYYKGMIHPYGDFLPYADAQTSFLVIFKFIKKLGLDFSGYELFVLQSLPILFMVLGLFFMTKVLRYFEIPLIYALIFSFLICLLSPQMYRIQGHYSLCYLVIVPGFWYWYLKLDLQNWLSKSLFTFGLVFVGFVHPYLLLMLALFFLSLILVESIFSKSFKWKNLPPVLIAITVYFLITKYFDRITDRPANPWGTGMFKTEASDLFPFYGWIHALFERTLHLRADFNEGYCWLGILFLAFPIWFLIQKFKKKSSIKLPTQLQHSAIAGLMVLSFAMGIHLLLMGDFIGNLIPFIKQFRGLGRFSWPFYYTGLTFMFIYFYECFKQNKYFKLLLGIVILLYLIDIYNYHGKIKTVIDTYHSDNTLYKKDRLDELIKKIDLKAKDYQAILTLPSGAEGAEKLYLKQDWLSKNKSLHLGFKLGLPTTNIVMSRVPLSHCLKINQLTSSKYTKKEILEDLESDKPFLTVVNLQDTSIFKNILNKSKFLGETTELALYKTEVKSLVGYETFDYAHEMEFGSNASPLFYNGFENHNCGPGLASKHALCFNGAYTIMDFKLDTLHEQLDFSLWYKIQIDHSTVPIFTIECLNSKNERLSYNDYRDLHFKQMEVLENWVRIKKSIKVPLGTKRLVWKSEGAYQIMDHALVTSGDKIFFFEIDEDHVIVDHFIAKKTK